MNYLLIGDVKFPESNYININMMPFILGDKKSIPNEYEQYYPLIEACNIEKEENGKIGYLTITETYVPKGVAQRRPGVHTDGHCCPKSDPRYKISGLPTNGAWGSWGSGHLGHGTLKTQGIYMGSNFPNTTRIWDCSLDQTGWMGDCEECKDILAFVKDHKEIVCEPNKLYWITDKTPHECLPMPESGHRQFFRLVTSGVDIWYTKHSTPNRLGIKSPAMQYSNDKFNYKTQLVR